MLSKHKIGYIAMKKPATPINSAAQEPNLAVGAVPDEAVLVAEGMAVDGIASPEVALAKPVEITTVVLSAVAFVQLQPVSK